MYAVFVLAVLAGAELEVDEDAVREPEVEASPESAPPAAGVPEARAAPVPAQPKPAEEAVDEESVSRVSGGLAAGVTSCAALGVGGVASVLLVGIPCMPLIIAGGSGAAAALGSQQIARIAGRRLPLLPLLLVTVPGALLSALVAMGIMLGSYAVVLGYVAYAFSTMPPAQAIQAAQTNAPTVVYVGIAALIVLTPLPLVVSGAAAAAVAALTGRHVEQGESLAGLDFVSVPPAE